MEFFLSRGGTTNRHLAEEVVYSKIDDNQVSIEKIVLTNGIIMDRLEAMTILLRVVEKGSFSAASRELGVPLATVSRKVKRT